MRIIAVLCGGGRHTRAGRRWLRAADRTRRLPVAPVMPVVAGGWNTTDALGLVSVDVAERPAADPWMDTAVTMLLPRVLCRCQTGAAVV